MNQRKINNTLLIGQTFDYLGFKELMITKVFCEPWERGKEMKKLKVLLMAIILGMVLTLTACGGSDPLQGAWRITSYTITDFEINWSTIEIIIEDNQLTDSFDHHTATFEVSDDSEFLIISSGMFQGRMSFEVENDTLRFDGLTWLRYDSNEYNEHVANLEERAEEELAALIEEEEERIAREEQEAAERLELATEMVTEAEIALTDLDEQIERITSALESEVFEWLNGTWEFNGRSNRISWVETFIFDSGEFINDSERIPDEGAITPGGSRNVVGYIELQLSDDFLAFNRDTIYRDLLLDVEIAVSALQDDNVNSHSTALSLIQSETNRLSNLDLEIDSLVESIVLVGRDGEIIEVLPLNFFGLDYFVLASGRVANFTYDRGSREFDRQ